MLAPRRLRCRALARRRMVVKVEGIVTTVLLQHRRDGSACGPTACGGFRGAKCGLLGSDQLHCTRCLPAPGSNPRGARSHTSIAAARDQRPNSTFLYSSRYMVIGCCISSRYKPVLK